LLRSPSTSTLPRRREIRPRRARNFCYKIGGQPRGRPSPCTRALASSAVRRSSSRRESATRGRR
jgi:hypothetical protein